MALFACAVQMSMAFREAEMTDEVKEGDGLLGGGDDGENTATNGTTNYDENMAGSYIDGEEGGALIAPVPPPAPRRRASLSTTNNAPPAVAPGAPGGSSGGTSMDAMQQRQFNKAARRASRLSINMDLATAQMFSMGTPGAPLTSTTSSLNRQTLKAASKLSTEERTAISTLFHYFRTHPGDLLALSSKLTTFQVSKRTSFPPSLLAQLMSR